MTSGGKHHVSHAPIWCLHPFLLFIFPVASSHCHTATAHECKKHTAFVPRHRLVGEGIDVTTMARKGAYLVDSSHWQYADSTCTLCQNPLLGGQLQRLPLAVEDWTVHVLCHPNLTSSVQPSAIGMVGLVSSAIQNDWKEGLDVPVKPQVNVQVVLAGSHSKLANFMADKLRMDKYTFVNCPLPLISHRTHRPSFLSGIGEPQYNRKSKLVYYQLINNYGTNYLSVLHLGGWVREMTAVPICEAVLSSLSDNEIKDCLSVEEGMSMGMGSVKARDSNCEEEKKKGKFQGVEGGHSTADLLFSGKDAIVFSAWIETLKANPGLVSYSLQPIYTLVGEDDPKQEALRQAVSEYITKRALWRNCTQTCPPGTQCSAHDPCSCVCPRDAVTNTICCSQERSLGKLTVMVQQASGLWGDYTTATDAFVKITFEKKVIQTKTIWNNNNPVWNVHLDFGAIRVTNTSKICIQVWDEDNKWDNDILGSCDIALEMGGPYQKDCYLKHGPIQFHYTLHCGPNLGGRSCLDYVPHPPRQNTAKEKEATSLWFDP
uniref:C2 domain-containing protein n=1 Tax=Pelusios castaneus TaxID=367368 RepID=A0A8C8SDN8_9SAUR